jgi:uncharacterized membrane protein YphA (DoxX/SURF4 family)
VSHPVTHTPRAPGALESVLLLLVRLGLAVVFLFAARAKILDPQSFAESVKAFDILPTHLAILATFTIPWAEALCAVLLAVGLWTRSAALVLSLQIAVFIAGILSVLLRGLSVKCGCFGEYDFLCSGPLGWCNIGQNALLFAASILILFRGPGSASLDRAVSGPNVRY